MKIEAVTVCVDYAHYLSKVVSNKDKLDRWVIVTHESDKDTIQLCIDNDIEYVCSKKIFKNAKFAKGRAINEGLEKLHKKDWILHIDADQLLPNDFRKIFKNECKDKKKLYGCKRYDENGREMPKCKITKVDKKTSRKKIYLLDLPIGFFQLWHSSVNKIYPDKSKNTIHDDWDLIAKWRKPNDTWVAFSKRFQILNLKLTDVCGVWGSRTGHVNGIRNLKQK